MQRILPKTDISLDLIKEKMIKCRDLSYKIKLTIIYRLLTETISKKQLSKEINLSRKIIIGYVKQFNAGGLNGLQPKKRCKSSYNVLYPDSIFKSLTDEIDKQEGVWSLPRMQNYIEENFSQKPSLSQIYKRLKKLGYSYKSSRPHPFKGDKKNKRSSKSKV